MYSLCSLWVDCHSNCRRIAEQLRDINCIVTHWINYLVADILQRVHHSSRLLVLATRAQRKL